MRNKYFDPDQYKTTTPIDECLSHQVFLLQPNEEGLPHIITFFKKIFSKDDEKERAGIISSQIEKISMLGTMEMARYISVCPIRFRPGSTASVFIKDFVSYVPLLDIIKKKNESRYNHFNNDTSKLITVYGIAAAMSFLHSQNIVHHNLVPESIGIDDNDYPYITNIAQIDCGYDIVYLPPEYHANKMYTKQGNVYSFSMIMYQILTGKPPFYNVSSFELSDQFTKYGNIIGRPNLPISITKVYQDLLTQCWEYDPKNRPTFDQICEQLKSDQFILGSVNKARYLDFIAKCSKTPPKSDKEKDKSLGFNWLLKMPLSSRAEPQNQKNPPKEPKKEPKTPRKKQQTPRNSAENDEKASKLQKTKSVPGHLEKDKGPIAKARKAKSSKMSKNDSEAKTGSQEQKEKVESDKFLSDFIFITNEDFEEKENKEEKGTNEKEKKADNSTNDKENKADNATDNAANDKENKADNATDNSTNDKENKADNAANDKDNTEISKEETAQSLDDDPSISIKKALKREQKIKECIEKHCDLSIAKNDFLINKCKKAKNYDRLYEAARSKFLDSLIAYRQQNIALYMVSMNEALSTMENAVEYASMEKAADFAMILYTYKSEEDPDYERIAHYLKLAGVKGNYIDCLARYVELVEAGYVKNDDCSELGKFNSKLANYEYHFNNIEKAEEYFQAEVRYYRKGAYTNIPSSMFNYAKLIQEGLVKEKKKEATRLFKKAKEMSHPGSMFEYAKIIEQTHLKSNELEARDLYLKAANMNYPDAMYKYAQILEEICMIRPDRLKAIDLYQKAADMNHLDSMFRYAQLLEDGILIQGDRAKALLLYKNAAKSDNLRYILNYANAIKTGRLGKVDIKEAAAIYKFAFEICGNEAYKHYSDALLAGKGESVDYYKQAADKGFVDAMFDYANILQVGQLVTVDKKEAAKYFKMAADNGHLEACYNYGMMLKSGDGVAADPKESAHYLSLAGSKFHHK